MIKIEKNVPMPDKAGNSGIYTPQILEALGKMEVGDSIVLVAKQYRLFLTVKRMLLQPEKKFSARVTGKGADTYRIFRTE